MIFHIRATFATAHRILQQLSHDHRTLVLIFVVPCFLMWLLSWMFEDNQVMFRSIAPPLLAVFPMSIMFLITSIATLRERTTGTLERILTLPIAKSDFIFGYAIAFGFIAILQASLVATISLKFLGVEIEGPDSMLVLVALVDALLGVALGLLASAFARTEFQAVQFMPAILFPQFLLCGLIVPLSSMPDFLESIARFLPLTYAVEAMQNITVETTTSSETWQSILIVISWVIAALILGSLTLRRKSK
ncbi:antibiotic ABC transporter permease [Candidatus Saccharibacteria bacterium RIFCSPHIGHO2_12_FULL_42_8]|nr:MAG: antibiotic ABC transporter permease [Candidatus Saccharibacteria bacterium RIFCSPHIGHO2_12_FULL_42_8]